MGGKSSRARQQVYLCIALLIAAAGCGLLKPTPEPKPVEEVRPVVEAPPPPIPQPAIPVETKEAREQREAKLRLQLAQNLLSKGDYDASLRENQKVLDLLKDQTPADAAVFNMGLIYAHPKNPKKDNRRAIGYFSRLIKAHPDSPLAEQAKIWVGVLDGVEQLKQVDLEIEERKRDRSR